MPYWYRPYNGGKDWSAWPSYITAGRYIYDLPIDYSSWDHYERLAIHAAGRFLHQDFAIVCDRQSRISKDDRHRPHCTDGPAIVFRCGTECYYWHGVKVTKQIICDPETLTREQLQTEKNSEIHRCIAERLGAERYLALLGTKRVNTWTDEDSGLGYELHAPAERLGADQPNYLRMQSPPLHDGTQPWFTEPVHPGLRSAQAARSWQFQRSRNPAAVYRRHGDIVIISNTKPDELYWPSVDECNSNLVLHFAAEA
jgi:hypothetical protein